MQKSCKIKNIKAAEFENLEEYAALLLVCTMSLGTSLAIQNRAQSLGILEKDEEEMAKAINWQVMRLHALLKKQMENIMERSPISEEYILEYLKNHHPGFFNE